MTLDSMHPSPRAARKKVLKLINLSRTAAEDVLGVEDVDRLVELLGNVPHVWRPRPRPLAPRIFLFLLLLLLLYHVFPQVSGEGPGWKKDEGGCLEATVGLIVLLVVA